MAAVREMMAYFNRALSLNLSEADLDKAVQAYKREFAAKKGYPTPKEARAGGDEWQFSATLVPAQKAAKAAPAKKPARPAKGK